MVTKQYNEQMASILPEFGIEFIEIPRKVTASDNEVISASRVRMLMKEEKWDEIRELVPETTYEYLIGKYAKQDSVRVKYKHLILIVMMMKSGACFYLLS